MTACAACKSTPIFTIYAWLLAQHACYYLRALAPNNIHCARSAECVLFYFYFRLSHISHITHILHICDKHFSHFTQNFLTFLTFSCIKLIICKKPFSHFTQMCKTISHISHILHKFL